MAEVPELSDLPMDISDNDEGFYANDIPNMKTNKYSHCHENQVNCLSKIKLQIRKPEKCVHLFKKVKALAIVVEKLKESQRFNIQHLFYDEDLLTSVVPVNENVALKNVDIEEAAPSRFRYIGTSQYVIRDSKQKSLTLEGKDSINASFLNGDNVTLELKINVDTYLEEKPDHNKHPVTLGIEGHNLYLCCSAEAGTTNGVLCLMEVGDIKSIKDDDLLPYIFYRRKSSNDQLYNFESVAFSGYYLSTSEKDNDTLRISSDIQKILIDFNLIN